MSGRLWVVEINAGTRTAPRWLRLAYRGTRVEARQAQAWHDSEYPSRVVQYVRQGGAR
jgi:hypothetical protein